MQLKPSHDLEVQRPDMRVLMLIFASFFLAQTADLVISLAAFAVGILIGVGAIVYADRRLSQDR